ncbi:MAG: DNRLRE domain-containing protein [Gaiellaceae bacterium]
MKMRWLLILAAATIGMGSVTGFAATMGVGSWHMWAGSQTLTKSTCTVTGASSIVDTYVRENSLSSSFGTATTATVRADAGLRSWMFIRFDLSSCSLPATAGADTATLKLVVKTTASGGRTLTVTPLLSTWDGTLTWTLAQALSLGSSPTTTFSTGTTNGATLNVPVTIDIDALIKSSSANYGWLISDVGVTTSGNTTIFNTVDSGTVSLRPQLVINYAK